jgi:preprotein translocase subunit SecD
VSASKRNRRAGLSGPLSCALLVAFIGSLGIAVAQPLVLDVAQAQVAFDQRTNEPIVAYALTEASTRLFAEFTTKNVGRTTEFRVDGRVVMRPVIREPILQGRGHISGRFTVAQVQEIVDQLSRRSAKIEVEVVPD